MNPKPRFQILTAFLFLAVCLAAPFSAYAELNLNKLTEKMSVKGDLRVRYEYKDKDKSNEDPTDRMRQRLRLGMKFDTSNNFKIAAGLATGGSEASSTNDTYSDGEIFETGGIQLDYAYAEHKIENVKILAGQHKNQYKSSFALWDSDIRPVGFTAKIDLKPAFVTVGYYDVLYGDKDMVQMEGLQVGGKMDMVTAAISYYRYHDNMKTLVAELEDVYDLDLTNIDDDYEYQIIDLYVKADIKTDFAKITPHAQFFMNMGAEGDDGTGLLGGDPEDENIGWLIGAKAKIDKIKIGVEYASVGADACIPVLNDSDWGSALGHVDVQGFKFSISYQIIKNCTVSLTSYLYEAIERDTDQKPQTHHFDLKYKF